MNAQILVPRAVLKNTVIIDASAGTYNAYKSKNLIMFREHYSSDVVVGRDERSRAWRLFRDRRATEFVQVIGRE
jgi:hypothetical protein